MALYESLEADTLPYVLARQRAREYKGVQSVFHLAPMDYRQTQEYFGRRTAEQENRRLATERVAKNVSALDAETLRAYLRKAENVFTDGDVIDSPEDIGRMLDIMSWNDLQELLTASTNRSILEEGAKNS